MANLKSSIKDIKSSRKRQARNTVVKSKIKTLIIKVSTAGTTEEARALLPVAFSTIDKAVSKGIIHKNTAARKKSCIMHRINNREKTLAGKAAPTIPNA